MTSRDMVNIGVDFLRPSWIEEELEGEANHVITNEAVHKANEKYFADLKVIRDTCSDLNPDAWDADVELIPEEEFHETVEDRWFSDYQHDRMAVNPYSLAFEETDGGKIAEDLKGQRLVGASLDRKDYYVEVTLEGKKYYFITEI